MYRAGFARPTFASKREKRLRASIVLPRSTAKPGQLKRAVGICFMCSRHKMPNKRKINIDDKVKEAEMIYLHHVGAHGIPPHVAECRTQLFKDMFTDSKIAQKFSCSHSKQGYGITYGLAL